MICLLCLPLLAIWTSPKSNVSMVNWLADCRFDLDYRIVWRVQIKFSKNQKKLLQAWLVYAQLISSILLASVIVCQLVSIACIVLYKSVTSSSTDGIAVVAVCCQSMSIL